MRIAVLGLGSSGSRHTRNLLQLGHEVVGFDPGDAETPDGATRAASELDAIRAAEAVVVASSSSVHAHHALTALAEARPVLVEKPLATTAADAVAIGEAARTVGVASGVAMNLRFLPALLALKQLVDGGRLGTLHLAEAVFGYDLRRWRPESDYRSSYSARADLGGGIVLDAVHELDYLVWLLGPVDAVSAETARVSTLEVDVEDVALALLRFRSGALGSVSVNFFEPAYRRGCTLAGSDAVACWTWGRDALELRHDGDRIEDVPAAGDVAETYVAVLRDFVAAVEAGRAPRTTLDEGIAVVRLAEAVKRAASDGRRISLEA